MHLDDLATNGQRRISLVPALILYYLVSRNNQIVSVLSVSSVVSHFYIVSLLTHRETRNAVTSIAFLGINNHNICNRTICDLESNPI